MSWPSLPERAAASPCSARRARSARQAVEVLAAHPDAFRRRRPGDRPGSVERSRTRPAAAAGDRGPDGARRRRRAGPPAARRVAGDERSSSSRPATTSTSSSSRPAASSACGPVLAALRGGQGRGHGQQGDPGRRRPPRHAGGPPPGRRCAPRRPGRPVRQPARLAAPDRLGAFGDLAVPRRANPWRSVAALILTASGGPFLDATPEELAAVTPGAGPPAPDLDHGSQDHDRLRDPRQQGPGGHRGALAVRCRLRRDRGGHPPAERRPLRRPVRRRLPEGPAGHPGYATPDPVRHDLSRPPAVAGGAARPDRDRAARLPRAGRRRGSRRCASPARRASPGPRASAALIAADDVAVERFLDGYARLRRDPAAARGGRRAVRRRRRCSDPDVEALVALDAEVRAAFASGPIGTAA